MECGTVHFFLFLLIIILIKESLVQAVSLDASPTTLQRSGDAITFTWKGIDSPTDLDWLGIYTPPESDDKHFIGYILLSSCAGWTSGSCSLVIPALNLRAPYQFRLFKGLNATSTTPLDDDQNPLPSSEHRLAVSDNVGFVNFNEPTQVHLSLTNNPDEIRVMFVTKDSLKSFVKYGEDEAQLNMAVEASYLTYRQSDMCDSPANTTIGWRDPGLIHNALLTGLRSGKRYYYEVGSEEEGWSQMYSFVAPSVDSEETDALLFGDMGTWVPYKTYSWVQHESLNTMKWLQRDLEQLGDKPTFVSHIGDISYARGYSWLWDAFFSQIEPVAARAPYHVCIGNHEYDWPAQPWKPDWAPYGRDGGGECGVPYSLRFHMPGNSSLATETGAPDTRNLYYSMDFGVVHFLYFSTETDFLPSSDQLVFIAQDLKSVDRKKTPFIVVLGHRPMYSTDNGAMELLITQNLIAHLEPLLVKNEVSLALWGHVHKYERTCPMQNFTCADPSKSTGALPVHIVIGMGGQDWQPIDQPRPNKPTLPIFPQPSWSLFRSFQFGYVRLHATKELLTVTYVGNHDGEAHDVVHIPSPVASVDVKSVMNQHWLSSDFHSGGWLVGTLCFILAFVVGAAIGVAAVKVCCHREWRRPWQALGASETQL